MGRREVSRGAHVSLMSARKFWHALGFPIVEDEDAAFTEADLMALKGVAALVREQQFDEQTALAMTRAFARTTDRLAVWQTQLMAEVLAAPELEAALDEADSRAVPDLDAARAAAVKLADLADDLEPLLVYAWRRHLTAAIARMLADATPDETGEGVTRVVGFADLVNFTSLVRRMTERQLAVMVQRFEALATDIVTAHGGRVIKTVGDEILFVTVEAAPAAAIALDLVETMAEDDLLPDVRVGMAYGRVISRLGDVFGTTVNRASRLTAVAPPGGRAGRRRPRRLPGQPVRVRDDRPAPAHPARHRAGDPQRAAPHPRRAPHHLQRGPPMSEAAPLVRVERHGEGGHVAELVLDRPEAMNAVSTAMAVAISETTSRLGADETVRAVVVSSTHERAFCVGADLKERNTLTDQQLRAQRPWRGRHTAGSWRFRCPSSRRSTAMPSVAASRSRCPATSSSRGRAPSSGSGGQRRRDPGGAARSCSRAASAGRGRPA